MSLKLNSLDLEKLEVRFYVVFACKRFNYSANDELIFVPYTFVLICHLHKKLAIIKPEDRN